MSLEATDSPAGAGEKGDHNHSEINTYDSTMPPEDASPSSSLSAESVEGDMIMPSGTPETSAAVSNAAVGTPVLGSSVSYADRESADVQTTPAVTPDTREKTVIASTPTNGATPGAGTDSSPSTPTISHKMDQAETGADFLITGRSSGADDQGIIQDMAMEESMDHGLARDMSAEVDSDDGHDQDESSSDDESSYFRDPRNLPHPRTERLYSFSSTNSAPPAADMRASSRDGRESDASLSFSEDSDEGHHPHSDPGYFQQRPPDRGVTEVFPQNITRIHSYSSLVSDEVEDDMSSDPSVRDELRQVAVETGRTATSMKIPSGRISPVLGEHPPSRGAMFFSSPSSVNPEPSPPTIMTAYQQMGGFPHPQPHTLTPDQLQTWMTGSDTAYEQQKMGIHRNWTDDQARVRENSQSMESTHSRESVLAYSEDSHSHSDSHMPQISAVPSLEGDRASISSGRKAQEPQQGEGLRPKPPEDPWSRMRGSVGGEGDAHRTSTAAGKHGYKVYWQRWIMLLYMSVLNLLSDWTCYSVAPIALLTEEAFGNINPEQLVVVFLGANAVATACEPVILSRLGLRRTVVFGALLLMLGSIVKSGGMPPIIQANLEKGHGEWRVYVGFFLVGLSQPLYQCTPALLSASWFPERERTMATGVALNANQLGIGFAFIFGTLLVADSDDIPGYFGLLSVISTIAFLGALIQFDDAPPTPPSDTARVMRGTLDMRLPNVSSIFDSVRNNFGNSERDKDSESGRRGRTPARGVSGSKRESSSGRRRSSRSSASPKASRTSGKHSRHSSGGSSSARRRRAAGESSLDSGFHALAPSPALSGRVEQGRRHESLQEFRHDVYPAPSPMNPGPVADEEGSIPASNQDDPDQQEAVPPSPYVQPNPYGYGGYPFFPPGPPVGESGAPQGYFPQMPSGDRNHPAGFSIPPGYPPAAPGMPGSELGMSMSSGERTPQTGFSVPPGYPTAPGMAGSESGMPYAYPYQGYPYQVPYWDPRFGQYAYYQQQPYQIPIHPEQQYQSYQHRLPPYYVRDYQPVQNVLPPSDSIDEGAEPVLTLTPHHLDIDIRDDQVLLSIRACLSRPGFIQALVSFTVSGIVINTLSTFMDYLVRLNGAPRYYTGVVGGAFQFVIMISSLIVGKICDKTRAYYSITIGMLVLGAFALAECGVSLDADRGSDLRWSLLAVALLVGPLQPVSTELGVDVVYPLSENTVLVIQQLFSNLLSAMFIPCFKALKDVGLGSLNAAKTEKPEYTFSFYLLIVLHAAVTVFFATFNGRYLRYEHELEKKAMKERAQRIPVESTAFHRVDQDSQSVHSGSIAPGERMPLIPPAT